MRPPRHFRKWTGRLCSLAFLVVVAVTAWFRTTADENPYATLLLFGPRWVALVPVAALAVLALLARSWGGVAGCMMMAGIIAVVFMGWCGPAFEPNESRATAFRILTFNADAKDTNRDQFKAFIDAEKPAIVALQDADRITVDDFPAGWFLVPASNGLRLASKYPVKLLGDISDPVIGPARGAAKYSVAMPGGDQIVAVVHLPTPRHGLEAVLARKPGAVDTLRGVIIQRDAASRKVREWLGDDSMIICGDFNLPVESVIYQRDWAGYKNIFTNMGQGFGHTMFSKHAAVRIDHILVAKGRTAFGIEVGPDLGSAHRPVLADVKP